MYSMYINRLIPGDSSLDKSALISPRKMLFYVMREVRTKRTLGRDLCLHGKTSEKTLQYNCMPW